MHSRWMDINDHVFIDGGRKYLVIIGWQKNMKSQLRNWNEINIKETKPIWFHIDRLYLWTS